VAEFVREFAGLGGLAVSDRFDFWGLSGFSAGFWTDSAPGQGLKAAQRRMLKAMAASRT